MDVAEACPSAIHNSNLLLANCTGVLLRRDYCGWKVDGKNAMANWVVRSIDKAVRSEIFIISLQAHKTIDW